MLRAKSIKFIEKLYSLLFNKENQSIISWSQDGNSFIIYQESELPRILEEQYMSDKIKTFYRQLRLYGFKMSKHNQGLREYKHPDFNINFSSKLNPIFRHNQQRNSLALELNDLRSITQNLQLQQLQMLKKLHLTIRIFTFIKTIMEQIKEWYHINSESKNKFAHQFLKTLFTLFVGHKQQFHSNQTIESVLKEYGIDIEIYTPRALC